MVVAPISCISPRESAGFRILAASKAPSAAPAPTSVWISSINRMISGRLETSFITFFRRSSNSPRYLAPAIIEGISTVTILLFFSISGTLPSVMRWASPSTTAVFPTPGSPIRQGLFFGSAREYLNDAFGFVFTADDRIQLSFFCQRSQIPTIV